MNKKVYRWQPELTNLIIYWSYTFSLLFLGLILLLEHTQPYLVSIFLLLLFFIFFYLGFNRYFLLTDRELIIHRFAFSKKQCVSLTSIEKIRVSTTCIEITSDLFKNNPQLFTMSKKNKSLLLTALKEKEKFNGLIVQNSPLED